MLTNILLIADARDLRIGDTVTEQPYQAGAKNYVIENIAGGHAYAISQSSPRLLKLIPLTGPLFNQWWLLSDASAQQRKRTMLAAH